MPIPKGPDYYVDKMVKALVAQAESTYKVGGIDKKHRDGIIHHLEYEADWEEVHRIYVEVFGEDEISRGFITAMIDIEAEIFSETGMTLEELVEDAMRKGVVPKGKIISIKPRRVPRKKKKKGR